MGDNVPCSKKKKRAPKACYIVIGPTPCELPLLIVGQEPLISLPSRAILGSSFSNALYLIKSHTVFYGSYLYVLVPD